MKLILEQDYELIMADSGEACLHILANSKDVGLVFMDIKMPKIHGIELLAEVKKKHPGVPVIMVTGYNSVELAAEASRLGASGYIVKPFKSQEILDAVKRVMG